MDLKQSLGSENISERRLPGFYRVSVAAAVAAAAADVEVSVNFISFVFRVCVLVCVCVLSWPDEVNVSVFHLFVLPAERVTAVVSVLVMASSLKETSLEKKTNKNNHHLRRILFETQ